MFHASDDRQLSDRRSCRETEPALVCSGLGSLGYLLAQCHQVEANSTESLANVPLLLIHKSRLLQYLPDADIRKNPLHISHRVG
jgi:hypothetical protein